MCLTGDVNRFTARPKEPNETNIARIGKRDLSHSETTRFRTPYASRDYRVCVVRANDKNNRQGIGGRLQLLS